MNIESELRRFEIHCEESLHEYLKMIQVDEHDGYCEKHHILPKSMYPEYKECKWNIVSLRFVNHVKAHELLCRFFNNTQMKRAYAFIGSTDEAEKVKYLTSGCYAGDLNPAKLPGVGAKISKAKTGVPRPDLCGKKYFGAGQDKVQAGIKSMSMLLKDTVIVRDSDNNRFRVSIDDERYLSGECVPFNRGIKRPNSASKNPEVMSSIMKTRSERYAKFAEYTFEDMVQLLVDASENGKRIFAKGKRSRSPFGPNYSTWVSISGHDVNKIKEAVVQRLSKG